MSIKIRKLIEINGTAAVAQLAKRSPCMREIGVRSYSIYFDPRSRLTSRKVVKTVSDSSTAKLLATDVNVTGPRKRK